MVFNIPLLRSKCFSMIFSIYWMSRRKSRLFYSRNIKLTKYAIVYSMKRSLNNYIQTWLAWTWAKKVTIFFCECTRNIYISMNFITQSSIFSSLKAEILWVLLIFEHCLVLSFSIFWSKLIPFWKNINKNFVAFAILIVKLFFEQIRTPFAPCSSTWWSYHTFET